VGDRSCRTSIVVVQDFDREENPMHTPLKFALRMLAVVAALVAMQLSSAVVGPKNTPYASSLSNLTAGDAFAAGCAFRNCRFRGERLSCQSTTVFVKCAQHGTNCTETPC